MKALRQGGESTLNDCLCSGATGWRGLDMAERSFAQEVKKLRLGEGEVFSGEGILAVTKALL